MTATQTETAKGASTRAFLLHPTDNVVTMLTPGKRGAECRVSGEGRSHLKLTEDIPYGHKAAAKDIPEGGSIVKYGQTIGRALKAIPAGACVHVHNIESLRGRGDIEVKS